MAHTSSPLDTLPLNIITHPLDEIAVEHNVRIVRLEENFRHFLTMVRRSRATRRLFPPKPQTYECGTQTDAPPPMDYKLITATHTGEIALIKHEIETLQREYTSLYNFTVSLSEALNKKHN